MEIPDEPASSLISPSRVQSRFHATYLLHQTKGSLIDELVLSIGYSWGLMLKLRSIRCGNRKTTAYCVMTLIQWIESKLVCEIEFTDVTPDKQLRQTTFSWVAR
jgi:hypothetical protein